MKSSCADVQQVATVSEKVCTALLPSSALKSQGAIYSRLT